MWPLNYQKFTRRAHWLMYHLTHSSLDRGQKLLVIAVGSILDRTSCTLSSLTPHSVTHLSVCLHKSNLICSGTTVTTNRAVFFFFFFFFFFLNFKHLKVSPEVAHFVTPERIMGKCISQFEAVIVNHENKDIIWYDVPFVLLCLVWLPHWLPKKKLLWYSWEI